MDDFKERHIFTIEHSVPNEVANYLSLFEAPLEDENCIWPATCSRGLRVWQDGARARALQNTKLKRSPFITLADVNRFNRILT